MNNYEYRGTLFKFKSLLYDEINSNIFLFKIYSADFGNLNYISLGYRTLEENYGKCYFKK